MSDNADKVEQLLQIVHHTINLPSLSALRGAAMSELLKLNEEAAKAQAEEAAKKQAEEAKAQAEEAAKAKQAVDAEAAKKRLEQVEKDKELAGASYEMETRKV